MSKPEDLSYIANLPDEALVPVPVLAKLTHQGVSTTWRKLATDPAYPKPVKLGMRCTRVRLGDIRALIAGRAA